MSAATSSQDVREGLATEFERRLFDAALANLADTEHPLRLNNFAYAIRELSRHVLQRLAPDERVRACSWYIKDPAALLRVTRRQRTTYAIQGGLTDAYVADVLGIDVGSLHVQLLNAIDNLSKYTHVEAATFASPVSEVDHQTDEVLNALSDLFRLIEECKAEVANALEERIGTAVVDQVLQETVLAIDELATHHSIDEIYTDHVEVEAIDDQFIHITARGTLECELQWGSSSDLRRGDGAVLAQSFPFMCELKSVVESPEEFHPDLTTLQVDTSAWRSDVSA